MEPTACLQRVTQREHVDRGAWCHGVTGHGNEETAVAAIKQGAFNYLTKPVDLARLKATVESALRLSVANRENRALRRELGYEEALDRIVGTSNAIRQVKALIKQVAPTDA